MRAERRSQTIAAYVFLAPWIVGVLAFLLGPMLGAVTFSFFEWRGIGRFTYEGLGNYVQAASDPAFWQSLKVTATFVFTALPIRMVIALSFALLLRRTRRLRAFFSTVFYIPAVIPGVALALLFTFILHPRAGLINRLLAVAGIQGPCGCTASSGPSSGWSSCSSGSRGWPSSCTSSGSRPYRRSCRRRPDSTGRERRGSFAATLPLLTPMILFNLIVGIIGNFQFFAPVYVMTQGGPNDATLFYVYNIYRVAFQYFELGYGAALSVILFLLIGALTALTFRTSSGPGCTTGAPDERGESGRPVAAPGRLGWVDLLVYLTLSAAAITVLVPLFWMISASLKTLTEVYEFTWLPRVPQWRNDIDGLRVIGFSRYFLNSSW